MIEFYDQRRILLFQFQLPDEIPANSITVITGPKRKLQALPPQEPEDENTDNNGVADENSLDSVFELKPGQKYQIVRIKGLRIEIITLNNIIISNI